MQVVKAILILTGAIVMSNDFIKVIKTLDTAGFKKTVSMFFYEIEWDEGWHW